jgi:glycosyltransferase involved in cell wall biosynthesis
VVGQAGLMFDSDDIEGVAQAIYNITSSNQYRAELSAMGLARAKLFDWDHCARTVADTLSKSYVRHSLVSIRSTQNTNNLKQQTISGNNLAGYMGYEDGNKGPSFLALEVRENSSQADWPIWINKLQAVSGASRIEGGLRLQGTLKSGTSTQPLITYVTVVRNNAATLERTIKSVQQQTYKNIEHIVLDGASTDGTVEIISRYAEQLDYYSSEPDQGLYDALNKAIPLARGQFICVLNSDDWLEPNAAEIVVKHMSGDDTNALLLTAAKVREGEIIHDWQPAFVHPGSYFMCANDCHNGIYATRMAYERSGPYDISYNIASDFKWIMRCMDHGAIFTYTKEATVNYSLGGTSSDFVKHSLECMRVVQERYPFLTSSEVSGLYHCFFIFNNATTPYELDRPANLTLFLRELFLRNSDRTEFLNALGWASIVKLDHPFDR